MVIKKLFLENPVAKIATNSFLFIRRLIERRDPKIQQTGITLFSNEGS
jgi:hypothetical protein